MRKWDKKQTAAPARRRQISVDDTNTPRPTASNKTFRRSSTITGSTSSRIRGVNESQSHLKSDRVQAHSLTQKRRRVGVSFAGVLTIAAVLLLMILQFTAESNVAVVGVDKAVDSKDYVKSVNSYLSYRPVERLRFLLDEEALTSYLRQSHPEVDGLVSHSGNGFGSSMFEFSVREPVAVWNIDDSRFFVDNAGVSFKVNHFNPPSISVIDESGVPLQPGVSIASNRFLSYVGLTIAGFKTHGKVVEEVIIPPNTTRQVEVRLKGWGYPIKLSIDRSVGEQVEDASRAVDYLVSQDRTPDYIDVRVSGKAFYR